MTILIFRQGGEIFRVKALEDDPPPTFKQRLPGNTTMKHFTSFDHYWSQVLAFETNPRLVAEELGLSSSEVAIAVASAEAKHCEITDTESHPQFRAQAVALLEGALGGADAPPLPPKKMKKTKKSAVPAPTVTDPSEEEEIIPLSELSDQYGQE
jgi:hypothetical protein